MKTDNFFLYLYLLSPLGIILSQLFGFEKQIVLFRVIAMPAIFGFYLIRKKFNIEWLKFFIFLLFFVSDIYGIAGFNKHFVIGGLLSNLVGYLLILHLVIKDFIKIKFKKSNFIPYAVIFVFILYLLFSILSLELEKFPANFYIYVFYGIVLGALSFFCIANYVTKQCTSFLNQVLMAACFIVADMFYTLNYYYYPLKIFYFILMFAQVLSYYFMVNYFIINENYQKKTRL